MNSKINELPIYKTAFLLLLIIQKFLLNFCIIYDNFTNLILEENSELIDVNDYHNFNLIVTTSKRIYTGIPPKLKTTTEAQLINSSSIATLNSNYILAACLKDSFLTKINLNNGKFTNLLNYSYFNLKVPNTSCSLSIINDTLFFGYTRLDYYEDQINRTNFVLRLIMINQDSIDGPELNLSASIKRLKFNSSSIKTDSRRQIGCEPLKIVNDDDFRLLCFQEEFKYADDHQKNRFFIYATIIQKYIMGFENSENDTLIYRYDIGSGIKLQRISETKVRLIIKSEIFILNLSKDGNKIVIQSNHDIRTDNSEVDLYDYKDGYFVNCLKTNFFGYNNIYSFKIIKNSLSNYFVLYNYKETLIKELSFYYDKTNDIIVILYQCSNDIKYYIMYNSKKFYEIDGSKIYQKTLKVKSNEERYFYFSNMTNITQYGSLNVLKIGRYKNTTNNKNETFGIDFKSIILSDNTIFINKTLNLWYDYYLSFVEHIEDNYTRIYHLNNYIYFRLRTCYETRCGSCRTNYSICDDCIYENYALIKNGNRTCYPIDKYIKGYMYKNKSNLFEKCYSSCDFCSSISSNDTKHKCLSCSNGYLASYKNPGNCYKPDDINFITSSCSKYIINSTNECIDECPTKSHYYSFEYKTEIENYEKTSLKPPKYLFNKRCYEECPTNSISKENNICECKFAFYIDNNNEIECYNDNNCPDDHPYQNPDTMECYSSLNECFNKGNNYFFNKECYKNECINNKIALKNQTTNIKNFIKNKLKLDDNLIDKICICDIENGVWTNNNSNSESYFQNCLSECTIGYEPENITNYCVEKIEPPTTEITIIPTQPPITEITVFPTQSPSTEITTILTQTPTTEITTIPTQPPTTEIIVFPTQPPSTEINIISTQSPTNEITNILTQLPTNEITDMPTQITTNEITNISTQSSTNEITTIPTQLLTNEITNIHTQSLTNEITNFSTQSSTNKITNILTQSSTNEITNIPTQISTIKDIEINTDISIDSSYTEIIDIKTDSTNNMGIIFINSDTIINESYHIVTNSESIITSDKTSIITETFNSEQKSNNDEIVTSESIINKESGNKCPEDYKDSDNCLVLYNNKCYNSCPQGTCISQNDSKLMNCISIEKNVTVFNDICFENMDKIITNIKNLSENNEEISPGKGIIIHAYSTKSENIEIQKEKNYSVIYLGECEQLLKKYYNLSENTELYILGIDTPNKKENYSTNVFNYGVFLENGTQLDYLNICKNEKVVISSLIVKTDLVKLENASYFSDFGYDIYDENSSFYTDNCAAAYIDNNDITLTDRKKYYYPENISLCNDSCVYIGVDFNTKRFICECEVSYSSSEANNIQENIEEDISYFDYFLSLINYKICVCYKLFLDFKSYYYNAGFYIAIVSFTFCTMAMIWFLIWGILDIKILILKNAPNKIKLKDAFEKQEKKRKNIINIEKSIKNLNNPIKKKKTKKLNIYDLNKKIEKEVKNIEKKISNESIKNSQVGLLKTNKISNLIKKNIIPKIRKKRSSRRKDRENSDSKTDIKLLLYISKTKTHKKSNLFNNSLRKTINNMHKSSSLIKKNKKNKKIKRKSKQNKSLREIYGLIKYINDEEVDKKELNKIPYSQALRIDHRNFFEIFASYLLNEFEIIKIFYYRNPYEHISISLSLYVFELCVDLAFNCLLFTDDVVSQKYNNKGSLKFFTTLGLSFMSNIISSVIVFIIGKLADYGDTLESIITEIFKKNKYFLTYAKFKKYLAIKLTLFFLMQVLIGLCMCYYLMIFCTVYHKTQTSIMLNYLVGISESMILSIGIALFCSLIRFLSLKYKWRYLYYTSKHLFENSNFEVLF